MSLYDRLTQSKFYSLGDKLGDLIILSLLWVLFSLPIVTIGASTAALYHATTRRFCHESRTPGKDFLRSLRMNLRQGTILTLIYLIYGGIIAFDIYIARNGLGEFTLPAFYEQVAYVLLLPIIFSLPYVFAYLSRFTNTILTTMKHSAVFSIMHPVHTLGLLLIAAVCAGVMIVFPPSVLLVPVTGAYLCSKWIERDFNISLQPDKEEGYNEMSDNSDQTEEECDEYDLGLENSSKRQIDSNLSESEEPK